MLIFFFFLRNYLRKKLLFSPLQTREFYLKLKTKNKNYQESECNRDERSKKTKTAVIMKIERYIPGSLVALNMVELFFLNIV